MKQSEVELLGDGEEENHYAPSLTITINFSKCRNIQVIACNIDRHEFSVERLSESMSLPAEWHSLPISVCVVDT